VEDGRSDWRITGCEFGMEWSVGLVGSDSAVVLVFVGLFVEWMVVAEKFLP
jgi:hypothetical protein